MCNFSHLSFCHSHSSLIAHGPLAVISTEERGLKRQDSEHVDMSAGPASHSTCIDIAYHTMDSKTSRFAQREGREESMGAERGISPLSRGREERGLPPSRYQTALAPEHRFADRQSLLREPRNLLRTQAPGEHLDWWRGLFRAAKQRQREVAEEMRILEEARKTGERPEDTTRKLARVGETVGISARKERGTSLLRTLLEQQQVDRAKIAELHRQNEELRESLNECCSEGLDMAEDVGKSLEDMRAKIDQWDATRLSRTRNPL